MAGEENTNADGIELASQSTAVRSSDVRVQEQTDQDASGQSLPPADGGRMAWQILISSYVFEALLWGFPLSFGVFQNYYSKLPQFADNPYVSVVGTLASGISYMGAPIIIPFIQRYPRYRRPMIWFGWPICILGLIGGSFTTTLGGLIFTQGIMYGFGFVIGAYPITSFLYEFWVSRRGMAFGLLCSATGVSGAALPFAFEAMLNRYGYQTTLRAAAIGLVITCGPLIPLMRPRIPDTAAGASAAPRVNWSFLRVPLFWVYSTANILQGLAYFFPSVYLPSYAGAIGLSSLQGALLLAIMSVSGVLGQVGFGWLSDRRIVPLNMLLAASSLGAAVAIFACWGLARTFSVLVVFAIVYGSFAAGFSAMWARMCTAVSGDQNAAFVSFGLFNFGKGVGNVLAGPISGALMGSMIDKQAYAADKYRWLVVFAGTCMTLSTATISLYHLKPAKRD